MRRVLIVTVGLWLAVASRAAAAPDTTVDFERVPAGAAVTTQYVSPEGVEFGSAAQFGLPAFAVNCGVTAQDGGIAGRSGQMACQSAGQGDATNPTLFDAAFEFRETRSKVGFQLRNTTPEDDGRVSADVRFYGPGAVLLNQQTISFPSASTVRDVFWTITGATRIAAVRIASTDAPERLTHNIPPVFIDNIYATNDDTPPDPTFARALQTPSVSVPEGSSVNASVSIRRFNGSTGAVNLSVAGGVPSGIGGVQFDPNPVTGLNPATMTISALGPATGSRQITVHAAGSVDAGAAANGDLTQTVLISPALVLPNKSPAVLVRGCGAQDVRDEVTVHGAYAGTVGVGPTGAFTGPATLTVATPTVDVTGEGTYPFTFRLDPDGGGTAGDGGTYTVRATGPHATTVTAGRSYAITDVHVDSASSPAGGAIDRPLNVLGPQAVVTGDLPSACAVKFIDQHGVEWPVVDRHRVEVGGAARDQLTLQVPVLATSGPLSVQSTANGKTLATTPAVDVIDFRNVFGSSATNGGANAGAPDYTWEDFHRTFGSDDVDRCFLGMCGRAPVAEQYHDMYRGFVRSNGGLCAGFAFMAMRFSGFGGAVQRPSDYQAGVGRAWGITQTADGTPWKRDLVRWYVAQMDKDFVAARDEALSRPAGAERALLSRIFGAGSVAYVVIRNYNATTKVTSGHAVVAYAMQENVPAMPGEAAPVTLLRLYDPNLPYATVDENTPDPTTKAADAATFVATRTLRIDANGSWSGANFPWSGANNQLGVVDTIPPENASLPTGTFLFLFEADASAAAPVVQSLTSDGKQALVGDEARSGSGVTVDAMDSGVKGEPRYGLATGHTYAATLRATDDGRYTQGAYAGNTVAAVQASAKRGQVDKLTVKPGSSALSFETGAGKTPVEYDLADTTGKASRGATIVTTASKGHKDRASLDGATVTLDHDGPAITATLTLSSAGEGIPSTVTTAPIRVGADQRLQVKPGSWRDLGAGARYTIRAGKRIVKRGEVRLLRSKAVSLKGVTARLSKGVVTVSGRIAKAGTSPSLAAEVVFKRHGKVVARKGGSLSGEAARGGAFRLAIRAGSVPKGATGTVTVTLTDEAAKAASSRATARVRRG